MPELCELLSERRLFLRELLCAVGEGDARCTSLTTLFLRGRRGAGDGGKGAGCGGGGKGLANGGCWLSTGGNSTTKLGTGFLSSMSSTMLNSASVGARPSKCCNNACGIFGGCCNFLVVSRP